MCKGKLEGKAHLHISPFYKKELNFNYIMASNNPKITGDLTLFTIIPGDPQGKSLKFVSKYNDFGISPYVLNN